MAIKGVALKNWIIFGLSILLIAVFGACFFQQNANKNAAFAAEENEVKANYYDISNNAGGFCVVGHYESGQTYELSNFCDKLNTVFELVALDGAANSTLNFNSVNAGNDNIFLDNVSYSITGGIVFATITANPSIVVQNSSIKFLNAEIKNNGTATLLYIKDSAVNISSSTLFCETQTIDAVNSELTISNNDVEKNTISSNGTTISALNCNLKMDGIFQSHNSNALILNGGKAQISYSTFEANNVDFAIEFTDTLLTFSGAIEQKSKRHGMKFNVPFTLENYEAISDINLYYVGEIGTFDTLLVKNATQQSFEKFFVLNTGFTKRFFDDSLYLAKQYKVFYNKNCTDSSFEIPTDQNLYFNNEVAVLQQMNENVRDGFVFLGWSTSKSGTALVTEVTINAGNITVYAVFEAIDYTIGYVASENIDAETQLQIVNQNPVKYNFNLKTNLKSPTLQYYTFTGFSVEGDDSGLLQTLSLPYKNLHDITVVLNFKLTEYNIEYSGLTSTDVQNLGLQSTYNIKSENLDLAEQSYLLKGKSYFGIFSLSGVDVSNTVVSFSPQAQQSYPNFVVGKTLTVVVKAFDYHNGTGYGTQSFPYILNTSQQFTYLITGEKLPATGKIYIKLENDITVGEITELENTPLSSFVIDGNNYSFKIENYINYQSAEANVISVFPYLKNCEIKNLNFKNAQQSKMQIELSNLTRHTIFAGITYMLDNCILENVKVDYNVELNASFNTAQPYFYASGFAYRAYSSVLNNCQFSGDISAKFNSAPNTSYISGFVSLQDSSLILNSISNGKLSCNSTDSQVSTEKKFYIMGYGLLLSKNLISNSVSMSSLNCLTTLSDMCNLVGFVVATGENNRLQNCFSAALYNISSNAKNTTFEENSCVSLIWSVYKKFNIESCVTKEDSTIDPVFCQESINNSLWNSGVTVLNNSQITDNQHISILNKNLAQASLSASNFASSISKSDANTKANKWYAQKSGDADMFKKTFTLYIYSTIDKSVRQIVYLHNMGEIGILTPIYTGYIMTGTSLDKAGNIKVNSVNTNIGEDAFIYVHYQTISQYIWSQSEWLMLVIASVLVVILLLCLFAIQYKKKTVNFIYDGKIIFTTKVKKERQIPVPKDKQSIMWFKDEKGKKPLLNPKMPFVFKSLNLYSFSDDVRIPLESAYLKKVADENQKQLGKQLKENKVKRLVRIDNSREDDNDKVQTTPHKKQKPKIKKVKTSKVKSVVELESIEKTAKTAAKKSAQQQLKEDMEKVGVQIVKKEVVSFKAPEVEKTEDGIKIDTIEAKDDE